MNIIVTGGAGFIGSHLSEYLVKKGHKVIAIDDLSSSTIDNIKDLLGLNSFSFIRADLSDPEVAGKYIKDVDVVYHLAANPEVRIGSQSPEELYRLNLYMTYNILEAMKNNNIKVLGFTSSSTVYGDAKVIPTPEDYGPLEPISIYGGTKLASEAMISAYSHTFGFISISFRLANVVGKRTNHGVIYDFVNKLRRDKTRLEILGDGTQRKSYIHVSEVVDGMYSIIERAVEEKIPYDVYNIGSEDDISVMEIAKIVIDKMGLSPKIEITGGVDDGRGWKGDVKYMRLCIEKAKKRGWIPRLNSRDSIRLAVEEIL
ncbi:MAG: NAD-dependent epimerase/dehydratase family protein [Caldisphaeraceae archaeon]|nr:NAD-dependent epimerase/dehydratase family protein [Caldisphaeraceae archaeon]